MARVNFEEKWWSDPRRGRLIEKLGSALIADGLMVNLWRVSQDHNGEPFEWTGLFDDKHIQAVASVCLASLEQNRVYVKGAKEHHDWLIKKRKAAAKGGKVASSKLKEIRQAGAKHHSSTTQANERPLALALTLSSSSSSSAEVSDAFYDEKKTAFTQIIDSAYALIGKKPDVELIRKLPLVVVAYKSDPAHFKDDVDGLLNSEIDDERNRGIYLSRAILKKVGARQ